MFVYTAVCWYRRTPRAPASGSAQLQRAAKKVGQAKRQHQHSTAKRHSRPQRLSRWAENPTLNPQQKGSLIEGEVKGPGVQCQLGTKPGPSADHTFLTPEQTVPMPRLKGKSLGIFLGGHDGRQKGRDIRIGTRVRVKLSQRQASGSRPRSSSGEFHNQPRWEANRCF